MITEPVYIVDVVGEVVAEAMGAFYAKDINDSDLTLLDFIKQSEQTVLGDTLITTIDYQYGHVQELIETLGQMTKSQEETYKKYPLVWLVQDFQERRIFGSGYYAEVDLNIIIAHQTVNTYKISNRMSNVFKPVLYPIYYALLEAFAKNKWIVQGPAYGFDHTKTDRSYWGSNPLDGNKGNVLTDYVDAIELQNLNLKINFKNC